MCVCTKICKIKFISVKQHQMDKYIVVYSFYGVVYNNKN